MVASTKVNRSQTPRKPTTTTTLHKKLPKPNASILSFFQKTQKQEDSLFVDPAREPVSVAEDLYGGDDNHRYNELESPNKRRRTSVEQHASLVEKHTVCAGAAEPAVTQTRSKMAKPKVNTPFVIDSDSEDESDDEGAKAGISAEPMPVEKSAAISHSSRGTSPQSPTTTHASLIFHVEETSGLKQENTMGAHLDDLGDYADLDDLDLDEFEGEETRERRFMHEQARLEAEEAGALLNEDFTDDLLNDQTMIECCPICNGSLAGVSADDATKHVNSCLDGNPIPLPKQEESTTSDAPVVEAAEISKRFARAAVPRPGQANPFDIGASTKESKSAFSQLMSNKAEDSAWATAAAAENATRGRPSYERTCPFYKIMPGFAICVDAFRYGAVEGCKAYFLSHFHSDHYIGLTAKWTHGPIYCSKATGGLVKQQLRTAAKWVVELDFEKLYDIPGTGGASVTMIPANHCPGSSLFLFQKPISNDTNGRAKRILHCGDFRACPAQVGHPLLKPDTLDSVSGKLKQQKIDICYLDTTYLNPRYSFPPQNDVIRACADLCSTMSPDPKCKDDVWDMAAKGSGTPAVSEYFQSDKSGTVDEQSGTGTKKQSKQRLLVICGTYSIGKERICIAIAKALGSKIFASPAKRKICSQLDDPELASLLTSNAVEAQVHMQSLMEIRAETLQEYLDGYRPHFSRIVGLRPSGWNFRPPNSKSVGANTSPSSLPVQQILHSKNWRTSFGYKDFVPQRGSTKEAMCFGVPYSEHSSFRELAMFVMALRIEKVIPTVNVGSEQSRKRMKGWIDRWMAERRRGGLVNPLIKDQDTEETDAAELWDGKSGKGGGAWW